MRLTYDVLLEEGVDIRTTAQRVETVVNALKGVAAARLTSYPTKQEGAFTTERRPYMEKALEKAAEAPPVVITEGAAQEKSEEPARPRGQVTAQTNRAMGFTGDMCGRCGQFTMRRNGSCLVCISCGTTTGCS